MGSSSGSAGTGERPSPALDPRRPCPGGPCAPRHCPRWAQPPSRSPCPSPHRNPAYAGGCPRAAPRGVTDPSGTGCGKPGINWGGGGPGRGGGEGGRVHWGGRGGREEELWRLWRLGSRRVAPPRPRGWLPRRQRSARRLTRGTARAASRTKKPLPRRGVGGAAAAEGLMAPCGGKRGIFGVGGGSPWGMAATSSRTGWQQGMTRFPFDLTPVVSPPVAARGRRGLVGCRHVAPRCRHAGMHGGAGAAFTPV